MPKFSLAPQKIWVAHTLGGLQPPSPPRPVRLWACAQKVVFCFLGLSLVDREPFAWVHRFEHAIQANTLFRRCICFHIEQKVLSTVSMNTIGNYGWVPYLADEWFRSFQTLIPTSNFWICGRNAVVLPFK